MPSFRYYCIKLSLSTILKCHNQDRERGMEQNLSLRTYKTYLKHCCYFILWCKAGIKEKSAHDIRRTVASLMFNVGRIPIEIIRDFLGHSDIKTT